MRRRPLALSLILALFCCGHARAWGRHDVLTELAIERGDFSALHALTLSPESIDAAAPDLLRRVMPGLNQWCALYAREHDTRYLWQPADPLAFGRGLSDREALLWSLQNNIRAPLDFSVTSSDKEGARRTPTFGAPGMPRRGSAADVLIRFVEEPDALLDAGLNSSPYLGGLRESMSLFFDGGAHTQTFRHYYVPSSLIPPLLAPLGVAPHRAALFARLAIGSLKAGHRYWGYRFLAWSLHYAQDVTQPWHTVLVPTLAFLRLSRAAITREISAFHFLTEALADSVLAHRLVEPSTASVGGRFKTIWRSRNANPWTVAELVEEAAREAHERVADLATAARPIFSPIAEALDARLAPTASTARFGGFELPLGALDFSGNGSGAARLVEGLWRADFPLAGARDRLARQIARSLQSALDISSLIIRYVLEEAGDLPAGRADDATPKPDA